MADALDDVLRLVASGRLTAEEAASVIDALEAGAAAQRRAEASVGGDDGSSTPGGTTPGPGGPGRPRAIRLEVSEGGRKVVNLRVPLSLGRMALDQIPGLTSDNISSIRQAMEAGLTGPILSVDEDGEGNGVRIVIE
jgi:hypothetical protein